MPRIFFATDVHGSEICWKKFLNAGKFYKSDVLVLGGDMTGKALVPIQKQADGTWKGVLLQQEFQLASFHPKTLSGDRSASGTEIQAK